MSTYARMDHDRLARFRSGRISRLARTGCALAGLSLTLVSPAAVWAQAAPAAKPAPAAAAAPAAAPAAPAAGAAAPAAGAAGAAGAGAPAAGGAIPAAAPGAAPEGSVGGMGDINLYPKRIVIDDRNRVSSVGLYNRTANTGDYDIDISDMVMTPDGRLVTLDSLPEGDPMRTKLRSAGEIVRWSPHRVTLPGNEAQMVRIMARVPENLPAGEYRSHFSAVAVPPGTDGLSIDQATAGQQTPTGIGVRITPRFGISIPVIIRVGETTLNAGLKDLKVTAQPDGTRLLSFTVTREGTRSAFGDITITAPGAAKPVAFLKGVGVYTELAERKVSVPVDKALDAKLTAAGAKLTVTYVDDDVTPGKQLARVDFVVP
ncbi:hypothetical protein GTZ99_10120 [Novosphingobium sp. FSY-8]|uniref:Uncharacterized protein n=1 Tax=Novosphingobium ovatum TaxID=1908523 RepID=A0ABW9XEE7_9SPHN|nr:hypothetical protein [Novosphingobium ovatum]NBC36913.1 hypothetical protein [Novosphingobium ovatum]